MGTGHRGCRNSNESHNQDQPTLSRIASLALRRNHRLWLALGMLAELGGFRSSGCSMLFRSSEGALTTFRRYLAAKLSEAENAKVVSMPQITAADWQKLKQEKIVHSSHILSDAEVRARMEMIGS